MNKVKKTNIYGLMIIMLHIIFFSCKKDDIAANNLEAEIAKNLAAYNEIPINSGDTVLLNLNLVLLGKKSAGFPVLLEKAAGSDLEVTASIDNNPQLISIYDSLYRTHSPVLPGGLFKVSRGGKLTVNAGQLQSADSIKIELNDGTGLKIGNHTYVVPVRLESTVKKPGLKSKLMFLRYKLLVRRLNVSLQGLSGIGDIIVLNTPDVVQNIFVQARLSQAVPRNIEVSVETVSNQEFVAAYNAANGTKHLPFPEGGYTIAPSTGVIPAHKMFLSEPILVQLTNLSLFNPSSIYLLALKIKDDKIASPNNHTQYIIMRGNNIDRSNTGLNGQPIERIGWRVKALGYYRQENLVPELVLDGDHRTAWDSDGQLPQWLELDMGVMETVKGFSIVPSYLYREDDFLQMEVFSSNDGINWESQGLYTGTATSDQSSPATPDLKTVKFVNPVTARYFKFNILKATSGNYTGMGELFGIK
ncbi:hypothetical protein ABIE26_003936 [Pedobacter africanus]|uniref:Uncharacterized protein n=1 Tax=Pedobacter africanus TaxID=151894 RepID=A0ACC6L1C8_9SPHI|nr:DUF1735 domain-containing protein [Pedobacter africanus]MDR6785237.1 hypothetical protein [Pedobacter africanus]